MKEHEVTLGEMFDAVCEHLPEGWQLTLTMVLGEASYSLEDPEGDPVEVCTDDLDTGEALLAYINRARQAEGLLAVWHPMGGLPTTPELVAAAERELEGNPVEMPEALKDPMAVLRQIEGRGAGR